MLYISAVLTLLLIILCGQFKENIFSFIQFVTLNKLRFLATILKVSRYYKCLTQ